MLDGIALEMLRDINKNTVDFVDNYDASERERSYLHVSLTFSSIVLLGFAVGMATSLHPHNLENHWRSEADDGYPGDNLWTYGEILHSRNFPKHR